MEKTYTEQVHYKITFEGVYSRTNCYEEELHEKADDLYDLVIDYVDDNITDLIPVVELSQLQHFEEEGESDIQPYPDSVGRQFLRRMIEAYEKNMK